MSPMDLVMRVCEAQAPIPELGLMTVDAVRQFRDEAERDSPLAAFQPMIEEIGRNMAKHMQETLFQSLRATPRHERHQSGMRVPLNQPGAAQSLGKDDEWRLF